MNGTEFVEASVAITAAVIDGDTTTAARHIHNIVRHLGIGGIEAFTFGTALALRGIGPDHCHHPNAMWTIGGGDIDNTPPLERAAVRMLTAAWNEDVATFHALFTTAWNNSHHGEDAIDITCMLLRILHDIAHENQS